MSNPYTDAELLEELIARNRSRGDLSGGPHQRAALHALCNALHVVQARDAAAKATIDTHLASMRDAVDSFTSTIALCQPIHIEFTIPATRHDPIDPWDRIVRLPGRPFGLSNRDA
jgi:hypothetical protein